MAQLTAEIRQTCGKPLWTRCTAAPEVNDIKTIIHIMVERAAREIVVGEVKTIAQPLPHVEAEGIAF